MTNEQIQQLRKANHALVLAQLALQDADLAAMKLRSSELDELIDSFAEPAKRKYTRKDKNIEEITK